jgi:hypothetical protein
MNTGWNFSTGQFLPTTGWVDRGKAGSGSQGQGGAKKGAEIVLNSNRC